MPNGRFAATVANSPTVIGQVALRNTVALLKHQLVNRMTSIPIQLITKQNVSRAPQYCLQP
jgi:ribose transport system substrate-binding protein